MSLYDACNFPWADTVVNAYASNSSNIFSDTRLKDCSTSPGVCPTNYTGKCPYGYLDCTIGNSKYVCRFNDYSSRRRVLSVRDGLYWVPGFKGNLGLKYAVYSGYVSGLSSTGSSYCVEEVNLGAAKSSNCYAVGQTGCSLGGVAPPVTNFTTTTAVATSPVLPMTRSTIPTGGSGTGPAVVSPTNKGSNGNSVHYGGVRTVKKAALLLFLPLIPQLAFI